MTETNAFTDVLGDEGDGTSAETDDVTGPVTDAVMDVSQFADEVRTTVPQSDGIRNDTRYEDDDTDGKADDVDPRKLFAKPTLNELRYYYREGPYGGTIVEKPIKDAFKHGFDIVGDNTERDADGSGRIQDFLEDYLPYYVDAEIRSRRDGLALLQFQTVDRTTSLAEPMPDVAEHRGFKVWTVDSLSDDLADSTVAEHTDYEQDQIYVSEGTENGGVAMVDDISDPAHGEVLGYGIEPRQDSEDVQDVAFVHESRVQPFRWGEHVDGQLGNNVTGKHVGESILTSILQPLKAAQMGFWAIKNVFFRYSSPLHAVEPPEKWGQDDFDEARKKLDDLSMASDAVLPPGSELSVAEGISEFDFDATYDVVVEAMCAGTVFTKSVLEGTQVGTVSGSETDVKGYFNGVQELRKTRTERKFRGAVEMVSDYDQTVVPRVADPRGFDVEWGPLFKPTDMEMAEGMVSVITAVTNGINNYVVTPEEARDIVEAEWATFDTDVDFDELTEDDWDDLDRINLRQASSTSPEDEPDMGGTRENPRLNNGGGQPAGQTRSSSQPTRADEATTDGLSDDELDAIADRVVARLADDTDD